MTAPRFKMRGDGSELAAVMQRKAARFDASTHRRAVAFEAGALTTRRASNFPTKRYRPRSPDREASRQRRRMLGGSGVMPHRLRWHYTEGERAALCVIAAEIEDHEYCDFPIDKIAALAGVSRTTVQNALRRAAELKHLHIKLRPRARRKNLPNWITMVALVWRAWIRRGAFKQWRIGFNFAKILSRTKTINISHQSSESAETAQEVIRDWLGARSGPPDASERRQDAC